MSGKFKNFLFVAAFFFALFIFILGYIIYNDIKVAKASEAISIRCDKISSEDIKNIKIYVESPKRGMFLIPRRTDNTWYLSGRFAKKIYISFNDLSILKNEFNFTILIGSKTINVNKKIIINNWQKYENKNLFKENSLTWMSPDNIYNKKSHLKIFSGIINWAGDFKLLLISLVKSLLIIAAIVFLCVIFQLVSNKKNILNYDAVKGAINNNYLIIVLIIASAVAVRLLSLEMIELSGDSSWTWFNVKKLVYGLPYNSWDHHTTRLGKIVPLFITQIIFGTKAIAYYICPVFMSVLSCVFLYKLGELIANKELGLLSVFFMLFFPELTRASSQHIPSIYSITYMIISAYFLIRYIKFGMKRHLVASSLICFAAYLSEITNIFFLPGIILTLFIINKNKSKEFIKDIFIYGIILFSLFCLETLFYYILTGNILGRIGIIKSTHLAALHFYLNSFWQIFNRYLILNQMWSIVFYAYLAISLILLFIKTDKTIKALVFLSMSFFICITFSIAKWKPLEPALKFNDRYLDVALPFIFLIISYFILFNLKNIIEMITKYLESKKKIVQSGFINGKSIFNFVVIAIIIMYLSNNFGMMNFRIDKNPLLLTGKFENEINDAYKNNIPVFICANNDYKQNRVYTTVYYAFFEKNIWLANKTIEFPQLYTVTDDDMKFNYFIKDKNKINDILKNKNSDIVVVNSDYSDDNKINVEKRKLSEVYDFYDYFNN